MLLTSPSDEREAGRLTRLHAGMAVPYGGDRLAYVDADLAAAFAPGDSLIVAQRSGALLHIRAETRQVVAARVAEAQAAFHAMASLPPGRRTHFFDAFADRLVEDAIWAAIERANAADVARARERGRDVTRLALRGATRGEMIAGLRAWAAITRREDAPVARHDHAGWQVEAYRAPLGVIGFVFEGRPNVLADACGVLATGNAAVLRIGEDAAATAEALLRHALRPALQDARLPAGAVTLLPALGRQAAWALVTDRRLGLAVARGSGPAVTLLGDLATQAGVPVSLHGVGGAWLVADDSAQTERFAAVVEASLDRKVCNTLNTCCIVRARAGDLVPVLVDSLEAAARRLGRAGRLHVLEGSQGWLDPALFTRSVSVERQGVDHVEPFASLIGPAALGTEWEWESTPEMTLVVVEDLAEAVDLLNTHAPRFVASLIARDQAAQDRFYHAVEAPFVGDGFTRWVDGQYALGEPELGLANWAFGRPLGRASVLTGAGTHTLRLRMRQGDPALRR
jgi:glutamate-5-semialdehyde dehydrogenase